MVVAREVPLPGARRQGSLKEVSYVICDLEEAGFPMRYISSGFAELFGCTVGQCIGKTCGSVVGVQSIKARDPQLAGVVAASGLRREVVEVALDALSSQVRAEVGRMVAGEIGFALVVNQRRNGDLLTVALVLRAHKHPTDSRSFCVGFQFDVTDSLPVKELLSATLSSGLAELRARQWKGLGPWVALLGREEAIQRLHQQADDDCRMVAMQLLRGVGREELAALDEEAEARDVTWSATPSISSSSPSPEGGRRSPASPRSPVSMPMRVPSRLAIAVGLPPGKLQAAPLRLDIVGRPTTPAPIQWPQDEAFGACTPRSDASAASTSSLLSRRSGKLAALAVGSVARIERGYRHLLTAEGYALGSVLGRSCNRGYSVIAVRRKDQAFAAKCTDEAQQEGILVQVLRREYETLRRLDHPNVVHTFHFLEDCYGAALVMEHCAGMRLDAVVQLESQLAVAQQRQVSQQVLSALDYLHSNGVAHRDLHAENVMVDLHSQFAGRSLVVKLLDFGSVHTSGSEQVIEDDNVNTRILPPAGMEGDAFAGDVFAAGLLVLSVAIARVVFTEDVVQAGALAVPQPQESSHKQRFEQYLRLLLHLDPLARMTAKAAHDSLPALELWADPRTPKAEGVAWRASGTGRGGAAAREKAASKLLSL